MLDHGILLGGTSLACYNVVELGILVSVVKDRKSTLRLVFMASLQNVRLRVWDGFDQSHDGWKGVEYLG